jgi:predicted MFS family arabinose efflux permease
MGLTLLFLISAVNYADRAVMSVLQEPMKHDLGLSDVQLGLLAGPIFASFYALVGLPVARLGERSSRKRIIVVALACWSAFTALCGAAQGFTQIALLRVGVGASEACGPPASQSLVAELLPQRLHGRGMAVLQLGVPIGITIGSMVAGVVAYHHGWRLGFVAVGGPGLVLAVATQWLLREPSREATSVRSARADWQEMARLFRMPVFCFLLAAGALGGNASHALDAFVGSLFIRRHGLTVQDVGGLFAVGKGVAGIGGALLGGILADRFSNGTLRSYALVPGAGAAGAAIAFFGALWANGTAASMDSLFVGYFFLNMLPSPTYAAIQNIAPSSIRTSAAAMYLFFVTVLGSLAPPLTGYISDRVAASVYSGPAGSYAAHCLKAGHQSLNTACQNAAASGLDEGLYVVVVTLIGTLVAYLLAARGMRDRSPSS